jgi:hypothetical protein
LKEIARATAAHFGIPLSELMGDSRLQAFAWPRQVAMFLSREMCGRSFPDIGKFYGDRDHTTILHGSREVERAAYGEEVLAHLMAIAAEATAAARTRASRELDFAQDLHAGRSLVAIYAPAAATAPAPSRRVMVPERSLRRPQRLRRALPSDLTPPSQARLMGARA